MKLSPHLSIYRFPLGAISSITNRLTGFYLSGIFVGMGYYQFCPKKIEIPESWKTPLTYSLLFPTTYHTLGGLRHFLWDLNPKWITGKSTTYSSIGMFVGSIGMTIGLEYFLNPSKKKRIDKEK